MAVSDGFHHKIKQEYAVLAEKYEARWDRFLKETHQKTMELLLPTPGSRILNIACGTGYLENLICQKEKPRILVGIDLTFEMLEMAKRRFSQSNGVHFQNARASKLPFKDEVFDRIVCVNSFHFFVNPAEALRECWRVLAPSGRMVIVDWCRDFFTCKVCDLYLSWVHRPHKPCYPFWLMDQLLKTYGFSPQNAFKFRAGTIWGMMAFECVKKARRK